jgi:hypothetical protein
MSKTRTTQHVQLPKEPTRKQLSRAEREAQQRRKIVIAVGAALTLVIVVLVFGIVAENVIKPNEPVASVNGQAISTAQFQARVRLARNSLNQQLQRAQLLGDTQTASTVQSQLSDATGLGDQTLTNMIDEILLRQGASEFNVTVSPEEVQTFIEENLNYYRNPPTPAPTRTPLPTPTVTGPITRTPTPTITPFPTATPVTQEGFQKLYADEMTGFQNLGFSEQDYRNYVETYLIGQKVRVAIASTVPTTTEQIKFKYIRAESADVPTVTAAIQAQGFISVYQSIISNTFLLTNIIASDSFDFVPHDVLSDSTEFGPTLADALFSTPVSQTTQIMANQAGTASYIAQVDAKGIEPLSSSFLNDRQQKAVDVWLQQRQGNVVKYTWIDRVPTTP